MDDEKVTNFVIPNDQLAEEEQTKEAPKAAKAPRKPRPSELAKKLLTALSKAEPTPAKTMKKRTKPVIEKPKAKAKPKAPAKKVAVKAAPKPKPKARVKAPARKEPKVKLTMSRSSQHAGKVSQGTVIQGGGKQATITFTVKQFDKMARLAGRNHVSLSEMVRQCVDQYRAG